MEDKTDFLSYMNLDWVVNPAIAAFQSNNAEASRVFHSKQYDEPHKSNVSKQFGRYVETVIDNGITGLLISLIMVGGMEGISDNIGKLVTSKVSLLWITLVMEFALLFSLATALSYGEYLRNKEYKHLYDTERRREAWECDNYIEGEQKEMIDLYTSKGLTQTDAEIVITILSKYKKFFVDVMMKEELMLVPLALDPFLQAVTMFLSIIAMGLVPLLPTCATLWFDLSYSVILSISMSLSVLFLFGSIKSMFTVTKWWRSGFERVFNGTISFGIALFGASSLLQVLRI